MIGAHPGNELVEALAQHERRASRVDRQDAVEVLQLQCAVLEHDVEFTAFEDFAVLVAEDGEKDFVAQFFFDRPPIDVEEPRKGRAGTVFQDIAPPRVGLRVDRHVIGHEIDQQPQAVGAQ
jgi:hypothetical protein